MVHVPLPLLRRLQIGGHGFRGVLVVIGSGATPVGANGGWGDPVVGWVITGAVAWGLGK